MNFCMMQTSVLDEISGENQRLTEWQAMGKRVL